MFQYLSTFRLGDARNIATIVGSLGTLAAVTWAVYVFYRNRIDGEVARFRATIVELVNQFDEAMTLFQANVIAMVKKPFDNANPATQLMLRQVLEIVQTSASKSQCEMEVAKVRDQLDDWVLYSLDVDDLARPAAPRLRSFTLLESIRAFLPVLFDFIDNISEVVFRIYGTELNVDTLRRYVRESIPLIWELRDSENVTNEETLRRVWRGLVSSQMALRERSETSTITFVDVFNATNVLIREFTSLYLRLNNRQLWRVHNQEARKNLSDFPDRTRSERLSAILLWKIGRRAPDTLAKMIRLVTNFERVIS